MGGDIVDARDAGFDERLHNDQRTDATGIERARGLDWVIWNFFEA